MFELIIIAVCMALGAMIVVTSATCVVLIIIDTIKEHLNGRKRKD